MFHTASATSGFAINVNVMVQPRGALADLEALVEASRQQFARLELTVERLGTERRGDVDVLTGEYHGQIAGLPPVRCVVLGFLRGDRQVWVTATARLDQWAEHGEALRALIAAVRVAP